MFGLSDSMSAVDGLIFYSRIPPWIHEEYVISCNKIETGIAGFNEMRNTLEASSSLLNASTISLSLRDWCISIKMIKRMPDVRSFYLPNGASVLYWEKTKNLTVLYLFADFIH